MPIRDITIEILEKWLPPTYATKTTWTKAQVQKALNDGHHPRVIAAEVWDEFALTLSPNATAEGEKVVASWQNVDVSVDYASNLSPRHYAAMIAAHHRARGPIRSVALANRNTEAAEEG